LIVTCLAQLDQSRPSGVDFRRTPRRGADLDGLCVLLKEGVTSWKSETAGRAALLIDMEAYFDAAMDAMSRAKHCVHLLNWAFEANTLFHPEPGGGGKDSDRIGNFLVALAENPDLDVRVLCWKSAMPVAATQHFFPFMDRKAFAGTKVKFVLDGKLPVGACHHQKMIVVDDAIAFCGGGDIGPDRWDTPEHLDDNPRREKTRRDNKCFDSRHEVMGLVDGPAALALGDLFRDRWRRATGETLQGCPPVRKPRWPGKVPPGFANIDVGISRTGAAWRKFPQVRENEALHVASIRAAKTCIYMENQYFTSPLIAAALADRLAQPDGPEVIIVSTEHSPSYFDQVTMDRTRLTFIQTLKSADHHGRFHAYSPVTTLGRTIIVHAKLTIIDDTLLRIGSANINNRSMGFDSECDLSFEAAGPGSADNRAEIIRLRNKLLAHWLGCVEEPMVDAIHRLGGVGAALEDLRNSGFCRLRPIEPKPLMPLAAFIAAFHLGDPVGPKDSWRPWKRRKALAVESARVRREASRTNSAHAAGSAAEAAKRSPSCPDPAFKPLEAAKSGSRHADR
jgi:phosphatidylserine/phosphatidylglycerophosphate/cardiolipin synthase-like enzyme